MYLSDKPVEKWDAYYEDGSMAGCDLIRGLPIPDGLYHLACECLVKHNDGEYLLMEINSNNYVCEENWLEFLEQYGELLDTYLKENNSPKVYIGICAKAYYADGNTKGKARYNIRPEIVDQIAAALKQEYEKDGVHPNKDGAKAIADEFADAILKTFCIY